ncbi:MAG: flagellar basal body P-ring formation chaperone FlgA [Paracoccaceae bacterium]|nr:flagellar basal body P-ring formation chaperone FlgA [Paracoccaceae bacterium]
MKWLISLIFLAAPVSAETVLASRTIRPQTIIAPSDIVLHSANTEWAADHPDLVVGMEAKVALYAGRPIRVEDVGPPATVERNQIILITFSNDGLTMKTEARSLSRGGPGDRIRVMNLASRATISARILKDGTVSVSQ